MADVRRQAGIDVDEIRHDRETIVARLSAKHGRKVQVADVVAKSCADAGAYVAAAWPAGLEIGRDCRQPHVRRDIERPTGCRRWCARYNLGTGATAQD